MTGMPPKYATPGKPVPAVRLHRQQAPRFATLRVVMALILREMASTYGRSPGGYAWIILEPTLGIALMSMLYSLGFKNPALGTNFAIFFATGILPFTMFNDVSNKTAQSINYSRSLLAYPRVTFMDAIVARLVLTVLTQLLVGCIILTFIRLTWETRTVLQIDRAILSYAMAIAMGLGLGLLNCFLMTMFPLWQRAWGIMTRPLFLLSGTLLLYENMPEIAQDILWWNPLMHVTGEMRAAFYLQYEAKYVTPVFVFAVAGVLALVGLIFLRRYHRDMLEG
jgi:capsular polysaccharide transport system permease protein